MFYQATNMPLKRLREEKKNQVQSVSDAQDLILALSEENAALKAKDAEREKEVSDLQALVLELKEGGVTNG